MIKIISLFSGCGGMDLGFKLSGGFDIRWANDIDSKACETYRKNIGDHIVCGDIKNIHHSTIPNADLILGGFPCQDFSILSKRGGIEKERGNLYQSFVSIVSEKQPTMFIAENVKGLLTANKGNAIKKIISDFENTGEYGYKVTPHLVNFANYGVAQLRERVLIVGVRGDIKNQFCIPQATHNKTNYVSSKDALQGVEKVLYNNEHQNIKQKTIEKLKLIPAGGNYTNIPRESRHYVKGMMSNIYRRLHPDKPSTTIIASGGGGTWGYHYKENRPLTNRERARLFGYPDDFVFEGSITDIRRQIGNSVPPSGIKYFADAVKYYVYNTCF